MPEFKFFISRDKFSRITQIFLKVTNVEYNWKIQKLKNRRKIATPFGRRSWKIGTPFGTLARLLAHWHVKIRSWHAFGMWARRPRWQEWHAIYQTLFKIIVFSLSQFNSFFRKELKKKIIEIGLEKSRTALLGRNGLGLTLWYTETVIRRCSVKKVFLEICQIHWKTTVPDCLFS